MAGKRILIVEDEFLVGLNIQTILSGAGFDVSGPAVNVTAALQLISDDGFNAAVLDVNLGNGETSGRIAVTLSAQGIPFVLVTGYGRENLPPELKEAPLLEKPVDENKLIETVKKLLSR